MRWIKVVLAVFVLTVGIQAQTGSQAAATLPRLIRFAGEIRNADGTARTGVVGVMFSLYTDQQGSTALWTELQNVTLDANGQYSVLLGSQHTEGVPADLFTSNEARWLGIQVEAEPEQPRVLLVSVPYALKAGDAETLGGRPLSAFLLNPNADATGATGTSTGTSTTTQASASGVQTYSVNTSGSGGTANYVTKWIDASTLGNSLIYDNGTNVGIGTTGPGSKFTVSDTSMGDTFRIENFTAASQASFSLITDNLGWSIGAAGSTNSGGANLFFVNLHGLGDVLGINGNGNVGVGTTGAGSRLTVHDTSAADTIRIENPTALSQASFSLITDNLGWSIGAAGSTNSGGPNLFFLNLHGLGDVLAINGSGNVGIGTTTPSQRLSVAGTIQSTSGGFKFPDGSTMTSATNNTAPTSYTSSTTDQVLHVTQNGAGAGSLTIATLPSAIRGDSSASTGFIAGVLGSSASPSGFGVFGENLASSGNAVGTFGVSTTSTTGTGVWGEAESTTGTTVGVYGKSASTNGSLAGGTGVLGYANSTTGDAVGVYGLSDSTTGTGVWGDVSAGTGTTFGVYGRVASAGGTAGVFDNTNGGNLLLGRSGLGSTSVFRVDSTGKGYFNGGTATTGADFAESVEVSGVSADYKPGDVLMIDPAGYRRLALTSEAYSTKVAGIYSTKPGVLASLHTMDDPRLAGEVPLAVVGIVPCKVNTENGPIEPGDLLVSSSTPGYAMKGTNRGRMLGAVVGKAMQSLKQGTGVIEVLVTLQ